MLWNQISIIFLIISFVSANLSVPSDQPVRNDYFSCEIDCETSIEYIKNFTRSNDHGNKMKLEVLSPSGIKEPMTLKLIPQISVNVKSLHIGIQKNQEFIVSGMNNILLGVRISSSDHLSIVQLPSVQGKLRYNVMLMKKPKKGQNLFVEIDSSWTRQKINIPVILIPDPNSLFDATIIFDFLLFFSQFFGFILFALVIVLLLIFSWCPTNRENYCDKKHSKTFVPKTLKSKTTPSSGQKSSVYKTSLDSPIDGPIYGDTTLYLPQSRVHRRTF